MWAKNAFLWILFLHDSLQCLKVLFLMCQCVRLSYYGIMTFTHRLQSQMPRESFNKYRKLIHYITVWSNSFISNLTIIMQYFTTSISVDFEKRQGKVFQILEKLIIFIGKSFFAKWYSLKKMCNSINRQPVLGDYILIPKYMIEIYLIIVWFHERHRSLAFNYLLLKYM